MNHAPPPDPSSDEPPRVPGFRSWRAVYLVVLGSLVLYIVLLAAWSRWFK
jgi:hypothetical protein